jgi:hypothetical protein
VAFIFTKNNIMNTIEHYRLDQIHTFQLGSGTVLQGISPSVYAQNLHMRELVISNPDFTLPNEHLSMQIIGSRANGTANLDLDLDFAAVRYTDGPYYNNHDYFSSNIAMSRTVRPAGINSVDAEYASRACGIASFIPMTSLTRMNLADRLEGQYVRPEDCMPDTILDERVRRFGLPEFDIVYEGLLEWFSRNGSSISEESIGLRLLQGVKRHSV